jgi:hypothetical protein
MQNIKRLAILSVTIGSFGFLATPAPVSAQTKEARGAVTAVTDKTMTVKTGAQEVTFYIDGETHLEVRRAAKDLQQAQAGNPSPRVNDFFEAGTAVLVRYREENGRNHALDIARVGSVGSANPSKIADGKVTAISASRMTVAGDGRELTFAITGDTGVVARGASTATKSAAGKTSATTFVHSGDLVSVTYHEAAGAMTASEIRVRTVGRE